MVPALLFASNSSGGGGSSGPNFEGEDVPLASTWSIVPHTVYCRSDAANLVACADGDAVRWMKNLSDGVWYEQATAGLRPTLRADGTKWYLDFNGSNRFKFNAISNQVAGSGFMVGFGGYPSGSGQTFGGFGGDIANFSTYRNMMHFGGSWYFNGNGGWYDYAYSLAGSTGVNRAHVFSSPTGTTVTWNLDGTSESGNPSSALLGTGAAHIQIGARNAGDDFPLTGRIYAGFIALTGSPGFTSTRGVAWLRSHMP